MKRCSDSSTAGTPITVSGSACSGASTIQPNTVTVEPITISGANSSVSEKKPAPQRIANVSTPSGNLSATKTRPFHVIGSRSQRRTRWTGERPRRSGGIAIGTPSSPRARPRSIAAIPRQAASVASRMASPTMSRASAAPVLTPMTRTRK